MVAVTRSALVRVEVIDDTAALAPFRGAWDELAVAAAHPFCAPGWLLAWWRHVAPRGAELRVAVVLEGEEVIGVGPWFVERAAAGLTRYRPLGVDVCARVEPVCRPGQERKVAAALSAALHRASPRPGVLTFEGVDARSPWPRLMRETWPGGTRPWLGRMNTVVAPTIDLVGKDFDAWFDSKTSHFRQRLRRSRKDFLAQGGRFRLATLADLEHDLEHFARLHRARWEDRGGSRALSPGVEEMLLDAGRELIPAGRFRLWSLDLEGEPISSHLLVQAGGEVGYWLTGFDDAQSKLSPSRLGILNSIEDACDQGAERVDLGDGTFAFKARFADGEDRLDWLALVPREARYALTRAQLAPRQIRRATSARLSAERKAAIRGLQHRLERAIRVRGRSR